MCSAVLRDPETKPGCQKRPKQVWKSRQQQAPAAVRVNSKDCDPGKTKRDQAKSAGGSESDVYS